MEYNVISKRQLLEGFASCMEPRMHGGFSDADIQAIVPALAAILQQKFSLGNLNAPILWWEAYDWAVFLQEIIPSIALPEDDGTICEKCAKAWEYDAYGNLARATFESEFVPNHPVFACEEHDCEEEG